VVAAAAELFAEKGPQATSIRDIAARSGVNHGLVYRHFGAKESLVSDVLDSLAGARTEEAAELHLRVLARSILDGYPVGQLQHEFPFVTGEVETVLRRRGSAVSDVDARLTAGHAVALALGWWLFAPFLRAATGLGSLSDEELQARVLAMRQEILRGD
jgi:TetR/AcrR family transcriptional regulator, repressor for neighboring sulfatase